VIGIGVHMLPDQDYKDVNTQHVVCMRGAFKLQGIVTA